MLIGLNACLQLGKSQSGVGTLQKEINALCENYHRLLLEDLQIGPMIKEGIQMFRSRAKFNLELQGGTTRWYKS